MIEMEVKSKNQIAYKTKSGTNVLLVAHDSHSLELQDASHNIHHSAGHSSMKVHIAPKHDVNISHLIVNISQIKKTSKHR